MGQTYSKRSDNIKAGGGGRGGRVRDGGFPRVGGKDCWMLLERKEDKDQLLSHEHGRGCGVEIVAASKVAQN